MSSEYRSDYGNPSRGGYGGQGRGRGGGGRGGDRGGDRGERRGIPLSDLPAELTEASRKAIGAAIEVHKALGPGFDADTYRAALKAEMDAQGVKYVAGKPFTVRYRDIAVSEARADFFIEDKFLVDVMARPGDVGTFERLALRAKLKAANLDLGLIINFAERRLKDGLVRVLNIEKLSAERGILSHEDEGGEGPEIHDFEQQ